MAPYRRAAISGRGSPRYQARFGHSTLVSWQLIVENEPTGRFVSRPRDRVTLIKPQRDADASRQPQSLDGQRVGRCPQVDACAEGWFCIDGEGVFRPDRCFSERRVEASSKGANIRRDGYSPRRISIHARRRRPTRSSKRLPHRARRDVGLRDRAEGGPSTRRGFYQGPTHPLHGRRISASSSDVAAAKRLRGRFAETRLVVAGKASEMAKLKRVCDGGDRRGTLSPTG